MQITLDLTKEQAVQLFKQLEVELSDGFDSPIYWLKDYSKHNMSNAYWRYCAGVLCYLDHYYRWRPCASPCTVEHMDKLYVRCENPIPF